LSDRAVKLEKVVGASGCGPFEPFYRSTLAVVDGMTLCDLMAASMQFAREEGFGSYGYCDYSFVCIELAPR
jgi:hypothetical protein